MDIVKNWRTNGLGLGVFFGLALMFLLSGAMLTIEYTQPTACPTVPISGKVTALKYTPRDLGKRERWIVEIDGSPRSVDAGGFRDLQVGDTAGYSDGVVWRLTPTN